MLLFVIILWLKNKFLIIFIHFKFKNRILNENMLSIWSVYTEYIC